MCQCINANVPINRQNESAANWHIGILTHWHIINYEKQTVIIGGHTPDMWHNG